MHQLDGSIFSHLDIATKSEPPSTPRRVAESPGHLVHSYRELLEAVSRITYHNPKYDLLFRGQDEDYRTKRTEKVAPRSSIYPTIYRYKHWESRLTNQERKDRFERLESLVARLNDQYKFAGGERLRAFPELSWAILQHYKRTETPLVDLTESLLTATSFATRQNSKPYGYVYVFALPHLHSSISYHVDERLVAVRLAAACPPDALRAHFQQAYFVGSFPHDKVRASRKNLSQRMIAKFKLPVANFWTGGFRQLPEEVIMPPDDKVAEIVERL